MQEKKNFQSKNCVDLVFDKSPELFANKVFRHCLLSGELLNGSTRCPEG